MSKDYYKILEVEKSASAEEIKKAYRKMAMKYHPDKNAGDPDSEEKFKDCAEAFEVLSDPQKKQEYDTYGTVGGSAQYNPFGGGGFSDIFSRFEDFFNFSGNSRQPARKGPDLRIKIQLSINDVISGVEKKLKFIRQTPCSGCNGAGGRDVQNCSACGGAGVRRIVQNTPFGTIQQTVTCQNCSGSGQQVRNICSNCRGNGVTPKEEIVDINVPKGAGEGMQFNLNGYGNWAKNATQFGDLFVVIEEIPHPRFKRQNNNLVYEYTVSVIDTLLGKEQTIETPTGDIRFTLKPGTQHKDVLRIQGKGVPDLQVGRVGDLLISVNVKMPKNLSQEERSTLEVLKSSPNFN